MWCARFRAITRGTATGKLVGDRVFAVADKGLIGGASPVDATRGLTVQGANGASMRQIHVSTPTTLIASFFGPTTPPDSFFISKFGSTVLTTPANSYYNGVSLILLDPAVVSAQTAAQIAAQQAANAEAKKAFGTDSVQEQIQFGFTGDVGSTPPFPHTLQGGQAPIDIPSCVPDAKRKPDAC